MYILLTEVFGLADSGARNLMLASWDGVIWYPLLADLEIALGLDCYGRILIQPDAELDAPGVWNAARSSLWASVRAGFSMEIRELYCSLREQGKLDADRMIELFERTDHLICEKLYQSDAESRYIVPYLCTGENGLYGVQGDRKLHRNRWIRDRLRYLDSKYLAHAYLDNAIRIVCAADGAEVKIDVIPYADGYVGVQCGANGECIHVRGCANEVTRIDGMNNSYNGMELSVFGASNIARLGNLSGLYPKEVDISSARQLTSLKIGSGADGYQNPELKLIDLTNNRLLEELDISGCSGLTGQMSLWNAPNIRRVNAGNTNISSVILPVGGVMEELTLPSVTTSIMVRHHPRLKHFVLQDGGKLSSLWLEDAGEIDSLDVLRCAPNLIRVRLIGISWTDVESDVLDQLLTVRGIGPDGMNTAQSVLSGSCSVLEATEHQLNTWTEAWPELKISVQNQLQEFTVRFVDWDGTVLSEQRVAEGADAVPPEDPERNADGETAYRFSGWDGQWTNVQEDLVISAVYEESIAGYIVRWYDGDQLLQEQYVQAGESAEFAGALPSKTNWLFTGWDKTADSVKADMDIHALFAQIVIPANIKSLNNCSWAEILAVARAGYPQSTNVNKWCINRNGIEEVWFSTGDTKTVLLNDGSSIVLRLCGLNHDTKVSGGIAPLTFDMMHLYGDMVQVESTATTVTSWKESELRGKLTSTWMPKLPVDLQQAICPVKKGCKVSGTSTTIEELDETLFLMARSEVGSSSDTEGTTYSVFTSNTNRRKTTPAGSSGYWWTRTPTSDVNWGVVTSMGMVSNYSISRSAYAPIAFCVG